MARVFISYRRQDDPLVARALASALEKEGVRVFYDVDSLDGGDEWLQTIRAAVRTSDLVVVLIGDAWEPERLADPFDVVRLEIATALDSGTDIVPLTFRDAKLPMGTHVADELAALLDRHSDQLEVASYDATVDRLVSRAKRNRRRKTIRSVGQLSLGPFRLLRNRTKPAIRLSIGALVLIAATTWVANSRTSLDDRLQDSQAQLAETLDQVEEGEIVAKPPDSVEVLVVHESNPIPFTEANEVVQHLLTLGYRVQTRSLGSIQNEADAVTYDEQYEANAAEVTKKLQDVTARGSLFTDVPAGGLDLAFADFVELSALESPEQVHILVVIVSHGDDGPTTTTTELSDTPQTPLTVANTRLPSIDASGLDYASPLDVPEPGDPIAVLQMPALSIEVVVHEGRTLTEDSFISHSAEHDLGTALPGHEGNIGISGSRYRFDRPFDGLNTLVAGDEIYLATEFGTYVYVVAQVDVGVDWIQTDEFGVKHIADDEALIDFGDNRLTLSASGDDPRRLIDYVVALLDQSRSDPLVSGVLNLNRPYWRRSEQVCEWDGEIWACVPDYVDYPR